MEWIAGRGLLKQRAYSRLLASAFISSVGDGVLIVALPLVARDVTHSSRSIAAIFAVSRIPVLVLSFWGAAITDRADARRMMVLADIARAMVLGVLGLAALQGTLTIWAIYVAAFSLGLFEVPFSAAAQRMIPSTVPDTLLPEANARLATAQTSGEQFIGQSVGGVLKGVGSSVPLIGDAASFIASAALLAGLPKQPPLPRTGERTSVRSDIAEGLRWFRGSALLKWITALIGVLAFAQGMVNSLLVQLAAEVLRLPDRYTGLFLSVIAIGNLLGTWASARVMARLGFVGTLLLTSLVIGISYGGLGFTDNVAVVVALMITEGVVLMIAQVAYSVLRQRVIPREMIGRVYTTTRVFVRGAPMVGALLGGQIAESAGVSASMLVGGVLTLISLIAMAPSIVRAFASSPDVARVG